MSDFDPMRDVRFRGKRLEELSHTEMLAALVQALKHVKFLEDTRPRGIWPPRIPEHGPVNPMPFAPRNDFDLL